MSGIITIVLPSIARVMGETALTLVGYRRSINSELNNPEHAGFQCFWRNAPTMVIVAAAAFVVAPAGRGSHGSGANPTGHLPRA